MMEESLLSWHSLTEGSSDLSSETINSQQKWMYRIMFGLMGVITIGAVIGFLLSHTIVK